MQSASQRKNYAAKAKQLRAAGCVLLLLLLGVQLTGCGRISQGEEWTLFSDALPVASDHTHLHQAESRADEQPEPDSPFDYTLCFAGDVSLADGARTTQYWQNCGCDITQCIDPVMIAHMQSADLCFLNNEFQYSARGTALQKNYTFRGDPQRVSVLQELGVDAVSLANNHAYDFGEDALLDTLDTLEQAEIEIVGAGRNLEEASAVLYQELDGFTVALVSGTRVEWEEQTKGATETEPGVFRTTDITLLCSRVKEASAHADFVVAYMHWGQEDVTYQEDYQLETGKALIASGADAVVGDHPHCLQGIDFYEGKPILYSLGNYWFSGTTKDTMLAEFHISGTADAYTVQLQLIPACQTNCQVIAITDPAEQAAFFAQMENLSYGYGISIDENGIVTDLDGE